MGSQLDSVRGNIAGIGWPPLVEGPGATVLALARQLEASQWLDADTLRARQRAQLGRLAPWLAAHSEPFARRLAEASLSPGDLATAEGLAALPPVDRRWFQQADIYCDAVPPGHEPLGITLTSGSTGEPLRIRRTRVNQLLWLAMALREHDWIGTDFRAPLATIRASNAAVARHADWGPPASLLFETGPALALPIDLPGDELLARVAAFGTGNLVIYPNALSVLLAAAEAQGATLPELRRIRTIGEILTPALRERTRAVLGVEIADAYSSQEAGYLALQCPASGLYHLMAETVIVELLRPDGAACAEGETGRVVVTDLHNHATPIVRYAIGDHAEAGPACPCGRGLPTIRRILGRSRNLIRMPDGSRRWPATGALGADGFVNFVPVRQFQLIQHDLDAIEVRLAVTRPLAPEEERHVAERIHHGLGHAFRLDFRYFDDRLPTAPGAKFEDFICLV